MGQVVLIRHGQAGFGQVNYDQLSPKGHTQARVTGEAWRGKAAITHVISGDMRRHLETSAGFRQGFGDAWPGDDGIDSRIDTNFNEYAHEAVLRVHRPDLASGDALNTWLQAQPDARHAFRDVFAGAVDAWMMSDADKTEQGTGYPESFAAFERRTMAGLQATRDHALAAGTILVFTSGGVISSLVRQVLQMPMSGFLRLSFSQINAATTSFQPVTSGWIVSSMNCHQHLLGHDPSLLTTL